MSTVTISSDYQIVIPEEVCENLGLRPGQEVQVIAFENRIELIPVQMISRMRGFLRGIATDVIREEDRL